MERLNGGSGIVAGSRQVLRAIKAGTLSTVYLANDADTYIFQQILRAAEQANLPVVRVQTMKELGKACNVDVATATAGILR
jgi:large subunit ribosomal protein L7A